jgi:hypothetical protein
VVVSGWARRSILTQPADPTLIVVKSHALASRISGSTVADHAARRPPIRASVAAGTGAGPSATGAVTSYPVYG